MKIYLPETVLVAAKARIRWLLEEFEHVAVNFSGGKDSTVTLQLTLMVAEEMGRLPIRVQFLDQEAEWQSTVDYVREVMADPRVEPYWLQVPFRLFNATSPDEPWLMCWDPEHEDQWMRPKEPHSIHVNRYGTDRFAKMFDAVALTDFPDTPCCFIAGVRASESPARQQGLTSYVTYKGETWGRVTDAERGHYTMYPIYDFHDADVWKAIHEHGWSYNRLYDVMYQHGVPMRNMRVSSLHHETALHSLHFLQEVEGETWEKLVRRLKGINSVKHLGRTFNIVPKALPYMFKSWREYRDYLLDHLIENPEQHVAFRKMFDRMDACYIEDIYDDMHKMHVAAILVNDYTGVKETTFRASHQKFARAAQGQAQRLGGGAKY